MSRLAINGPFAAMVAALLLGVLVAACSRAEDDDSVAFPTPTATATAVPITPSAPASIATSLPTSTASPAATATAVSAVPTPGVVEIARRGGTLNLASRERIRHQDVHQDASPALSTWGPGIVYSRLLRYKSGPDVTLPSLAVECELCVRWEMEDERTYVFHLRDDVRWQAASPLDGRSLTAADMVFSYNRQRQKGWPNAALLHNVEAIEALDDLTLRITLVAGDADFLRSLADGHSKIVAPEAVAVNGDLKDGPTIGSGPWVWAPEQVEGSYSFLRNPDYFEDGFPLVDRLRIHVIPDDDARAVAFANGIVDIIDMSPDEWRGYLERNPGAPHRFVKGPGSGLELALKTSIAPFDDSAVRRAALLALDPWRTIEDVWGGSAFVSLGVQPVEADWLLPPEELRQYFADPERARRMLRDAGFEGPIPLTIEVGDFGARYLAHAKRVADELRSVGFEPRLHVVDRRVFVEEAWAGGRYQMFLGPIAPIATPNTYLLSVLHSRGRFHTTDYIDVALDRLIEDQAVEPDATKRRGMLLEIQRQALMGAFRFMPATRISVWAWSPRVQSFNPNFAGYGYSHWTRVWLQDGR